MMEREDWKEGKNSVKEKSFHRKDRISEEDKKKSKSKEDFEDERKQAVDEVVKSVKGLVYVREFITKDEETEIVKYLDDQEWATDLKRRVQQYGYTFTHLTQQVTVYNPFSCLQKISSSI